MKKILLSILFGTLPFGAILNAATEWQKADGSIQQPQVTQWVTPEYPEAARINHIEGTVMVQCLVSADGDVLAVGSLDDTQPLLRASALAAVKQWKFAPRTSEDGMPILIRIPVNFDLKSRGEWLDTTKIAAR